MPPSGVDYASEFLNGYAPEYVVHTKHFVLMVCEVSIVKPLVDRKSLVG